MEYFSNAWKNIAMTIYIAEKVRYNNFNILRLLCALLVIVAHLYALLNLHANESLQRMKHLVIVSDIGLCGFFTISGYLILNSIWNIKSIIVSFCNKY